tara:strand:+ start:276 stop:659 length:384 start_codon:yes stop_codon:yes gene_type:complete
VNHLVDTPIFKVSREALKKICGAAENNAVVAKLGIARIRVGLRGGGCSGYSVHMDYTNHPADEEMDLEFDPIEGYGRPVVFIVDVKSAALLKDAVLEWDNSSLLAQGFKWTLPKSTGGCGCGTSFSF